MEHVSANRGLSLRVSVATLARVLFKHPKDGEIILALERKATLRDTDVEVISQPFGGAVRIKNMSTLHDQIWDFQFDSECSRVEQDFRIFIRPSSWSEVRDFCIDHFSRDDDSIIEANPVRELTEEFEDALRISLTPEQYSYKPVAAIFENDPMPTGNIHAKGTPTVRVYRIFETSISDSNLKDTLLANSEMVSNRDLCDLAIKDVHISGKGWANAILTVPLNKIHAIYSAVPPAEHNITLLFEEHRLDWSAAVVLDKITNTNYQRL
jgi:hypothetical protein